MDRERDPGEDFRDEVDELLPPLGLVEDCLELELAELRPWFLCQELPSKRGSPSGHAMKNVANDVGDLALELGCATRDQVAAARREQRRQEGAGGRRVLLGDVLMRQKTITLDQLLELLSAGRGYREMRPGDEGTPIFGDIAVRKGYVPPVELYRALREQIEQDNEGRAHRRLGEVLVERGSLSPWELEDVLLTLADLESGSTRTGETPSEATRLPELGGAGELYGRRYAPSGRAVAARTAPRRLLARDLMGAAVTATRDTRAGDAALAASDADVEGVFVMEHGLVVGMACLWDLHYVPARTPLSRVMSPLPATLAPQATTTEALRLFRETGVSCLPVVASGKVLGSLARRDLGLPPAENEVAFVETGGSD